MRKHAIHTILVAGVLCQRLGHISKQGNALLRFLLVEAAQVTIRSDAEWRRKYFHLALRRGRRSGPQSLLCRLVRPYKLGLNLTALPCSNTQALPSEADDENPGSTANSYRGLSTTLTSPRENGIVGPR
jgi:transposase IS116/IS110/IS902 family protein